MSGTYVIQKPVPGECARRLRFENAGNGELHCIIEEEDHSGDGLFEDYRAQVTIPLAELYKVLEGFTP